MINRSDYNRSETREIMHVREKDSGSDSGDRERYDYIYEDQQS